MPGGDRTGPMGMGPMTGRGAGFCGGYGAPGYASAGPGWGRGVGRGLGRGRGWWAWPRPGRRAYFGGPVGPWGASEITREEELGYLRGQASALKDELDVITRRVSELEHERGEE
jgi:hypothetical protein